MLEKDETNAEPTTSSSLNSTDVTSSDALPAFDGRKLVEMLVLALVDHTESVRVSEVSSTHNIIIEVYVAKEDFGKVIGRGGRHAEAIRTLITGAARHRLQQYRIAFIDPV